MKTINYQHGVGLMEILVALLVLAIGVLGFIALQYRAVEATNERVNRGAFLTYEAKLAKPVADQIKAGKDCSENNCTAAELADYDVSQVAKKAQVAGMVVNRIICAGNESGDKRSCIYVAWGDTAPTNGNADEGNCTAGSSYDPASTCLIMEVY